MPNNESGTSQTGDNPILLNTVTQGNCLDLLPRVASGSVDMVMTSPPYDNLRTYKGYSFDFEGVARELYRMVRPGGVVVWVVGDATVDGSETGTSFRQALFFKDLGFNLHDTMIWRKTDPPPQTRVGRRYTSSFEFMFVFSKGRLKTFNEIRVPCIGAGRKHAAGTQRSANASRALSRMRPETRNLVALTKPAHNVWDISTGKHPVHPAVFPLQLALDQISSWSNPGDVVLDPFFGSGTTGVACQQLGRNFIGLEISPEYCEIARSQLKPGSGGATECEQFMWPAFPL